MFICGEADSVIRLGATDGPVRPGFSTSLHLDAVNSLTGMDNLMISIIIPFLK